MDIENNVIETTAVAVDESEETSSNGDFINPGEKLTDEQINTIRSMLRTLADDIKIMEDIWNVTKKEFNVTKENIDDLYTYNKEHRIEMPDDISDEDKEKWDEFNGIDNITEEDVIKIFGENHNVIGIDHDITKSRVKEIITDFNNYKSAHKEYTDVLDAFQELMEAQHELDMQELREAAEKETDPEVKAKLNKVLDEYYDNKVLGFLRTPLLANDRERLVKAFTDKQKTSYYLKRAKDKLNQLNIPLKIFFELWELEKRILDEKYHKLSNMLLLYFIQTAAYCHPENKDNSETIRVEFMTTALDSLIRSTLKPEIRTQVIDNIRTFEDQFIDLI